VALSQTSAKAATDHQHGANAVRGVPVYLIPAFSGTKLYCLVTEPTGCEKLCYAFGVLRSGASVGSRTLVSV